MAQANESRTLAKFVPALVLLAICFLINYVDRGNISIAAPLLKRELALSAGQLGILFSAFFCTYTGMQFVNGWVVDRWNANWILAAGFLLWSVATAATGMVRGFMVLLAMRFILGIGESVALPAGSKILARHLPEERRGFASGVLMASLKCGNAVGTLAAGLGMAKLGWRPVFLWVGLASLLWLPAWIKWMPTGSSMLPTSGKAGPDEIDILLHRSFWGTSLGHFCSNYLFYFMVTWLPFYLVLDRHLSMKTMVGIAGLYYLVDAVSSISTGWLQDFLIQKGWAPTLVRKSAMGIAFSIAAIAICACVVASPDSYLRWLMVLGWGCGMSAPGLYTFPQTLAGPYAVGKWYGWQNGFANFAGIVGPALTGFVVQRTGNFFAPFAITAAVCIAGITAWVFVVGPVEQVDWQPDRRGAALASAAQL